jgi:hypothetical protein
LQEQFNQNNLSVKGYFGTKRFSIPGRKYLSRLAPGGIG